jgi:hypothetical protein
MTIVIDLTGRETLKELHTVVMAIRDAAWTAEQSESAHRADELVISIEHDIPDTEQRYDFSNVSDISDYRRPA